MGFREDDRGVSTLVGMIMLLAIVSLIVVNLQTVAVPNWNRAIEFRHNERVQNDLERLRNAVLSTAADGNRRAETVALGTTYPDRVLLRNPPAPRGTIETREIGSIVVENATASGEAGEYWTGGAKSFLTRPVVYSPNYNYYEAPTTVLQTGVLYNRFENANLSLSDQGLIDGNRIRLIAINGSLLERDTGSETVEVVPSSAPMEAITVTNDTGPVTLRVPTNLPNGTWADLLADEYVSNGGHVVDQSYVEGSPYDTLVLTLEEGVNYELRMAQVGVGTGIDDPGARYVVRGTEGRYLSAGADSRAKVTVVVRDRFNNPVSNTNVTLNASIGTFENEGGTDLGRPVTLRTDADGRATAWLNVTDAVGVHSVNAYLGAEENDSLPAEKRTDFKVINTGGGAGGSGDASTIVVWQDATPTDEGTGNLKNTYLSLNYTLNNTGSSALNATGFQLRYVSISDSGTMRDGPESVEWIALNVTDGNRTIGKREGTGAIFFDPVRFPPGKRALKIRFNERYELKDSNDAIFVSVTMYFEGGLSSEYTIWVFQNEI